MKLLLVPVSLVLLSGAVGVGLSTGHDVLTAGDRLPAQPVIAAAPPMPSAEHYEALARALPTVSPEPAGPAASGRTTATAAPEAARLALAPVSSPRPLARDARDSIAVATPKGPAPSEPPADTQLTLAGPLTEVMGTRGRTIDVTPDYLHGVFR